MIKKTLENRFFLIVLSIKFLLVFIVVPPSIIEMYYPFLNHSYDNFSLDPWTSWFLSNGDPSAFPYGYVMWIIFLPATILSGISSYDFVVFYGLTLLIIDFIFLILLQIIFENENKEVLIFYWCSPIIIFSNYIFGLNDIVPILLLTFSIVFAKKLKFFYAGVFLVLAISAKLSMIIAFPFYLIYFLRNKSIRQLINPFIIGIFLSGSVVLLPSLFSLGSMNMIFFLNQEIDNIYQFSIQIDDNYSVYLIPIIYILVLYTTLNVKRLHFELFSAMLGLAFLFVALFSPSSSGWLVWSILLLVSFQINGSQFDKIVIPIFLLIYVFNSFFVRPELIPDLLHLMSIQETQFYSNILNITLSIQFAVGLLIAIRLGRKVIKQNDLLKFSQKPFTLGISGDSASGKDTLADALIDLFGAHSTTHLAGDDYHYWDRKEKIWSHLTHLNPRSNDLVNFYNDIRKLINGKKISKKVYDHISGKKSRTTNLKSNDYIVVSGLHTFYDDKIIDFFDLKIFLDIDEDLRYYFKVKRDVSERSKQIEDIKKSLESRSLDSTKYILPQKEKANLIFSLIPENKSLLSHHANKIPALKLKITSKTLINYKYLQQILVGMLGLNCQYDTSDDGKIHNILCVGNVSSDAIRKATLSSFPKLKELLDIKSQWHPNSIGLMQLISLFHINEIIESEQVDF
tara:strand:+ start:39095 stop:41143 length:2049 start_codon:yes stop_codon:yes gene_type:complete